MDELEFGSSRKTASKLAGLSFTLAAVYDDAADQGRPARAPDPRARELADKLREHGVDVRLDIYFLHGMHGFQPPERVAGDILAIPHSHISAERQIVEADAVLMLCTPEYADTDPDHGESPGVSSNWCQQDESARIQTRVPALWWDWLAIAHQFNERSQKYIRLAGDDTIAIRSQPLSGASYLNLYDDGAFDAMLRRSARCGGRAYHVVVCSSATLIRTINPGSTACSGTSTGSKGSMTWSSGPTATRTWRGMARDDPECAGQC